MTETEVLNENPIVETFTIHVVALESRQRTVRTVRTVGVVAVASDGVIGYSICKGGDKWDLGRGIEFAVKRSMVRRYKKEGRGGDAERGGSLFTVRRFDWRARIEALTTRLMVEQAWDGERALFISESIARTDAVALVCRNITGHA
ncbi:MAG: hypothetical protein IMZ71_00390 [Chloroflexi bacterium]|nr:hypothetical protein [Chloroflexota bacterium]